MNEEALIPVQNGRIISNLETGTNYVDDLKFELSDYGREINMRTALYAISKAETPFKGLTDGYIGLATSNGKDEVKKGTNFMQ